MATKTCKCGKPFKYKNSKRCHICARFYHELTKTKMSKNMSEDEMEALILKKTRAFRKSLLDKANGIS